MIDLANKGREFPPSKYVVEHGKVKEFLTAIGEDNLSYSSDPFPVPPTFATVFAFWGGMSMESVLRDLGVEMWNVLHGEQEYDYTEPIYVGDTITGRVRIADIYSRSGMEFVEILIDYHNQAGLAVLHERTLIIVRGSAQ